MFWKHKCRLDWLRVRQLHLTATDVIKLIPYTATGRSKKITDEDYLKVYASKLITLTNDDCISTGAAARGHILEPYAVEMFNRRTNSDFYHWDDAIIHKKLSDGLYSLSYSPDATTIEQKYPNTISIAEDNFATSPYSILEIKSYEASKHLSKVSIKKENVEERWQLAVAMAVDSFITKGYLGFYHPGISNPQLITFGYDRNDLNTEIDIVKDVEIAFNNFVRQFNPHDIKFDCFTYQGDCDQELEIMQEYSERMELNPW